MRSVSRRATGAALTRTNAQHVRRPPVGSLRHHHGLATTIVLQRLAGTPTCVDDPAIREEANHQRGGNSKRVGQQDPIKPIRVARSATLGSVVRGSVVSDFPNFRRQRRCQRRKRSGWMANFQTKSDPTVSSLTLRNQFGPTMTNISILFPPCFFFEWQDTTSGRRGS